VRRSEETMRLPELVHRSRGVASFALISRSWSVILPGCGACPGRASSHRFAQLPLGMNWLKNSQSTAIIENPSGAVEV
jgi:hypothetical protein